MCLSENSIIFKTSHQNVCLFGVLWTHTFFHVVCSSVSVLGALRAPVTSIKSLRVNAANSRTEAIKPDPAADCAGPQVFIITFTEMNYLHDELDVAVWARVREWGDRCYRQMLAGAGAFLDTLGVDKEEG